DAYPLSLHDALPIWITTTTDWSGFADVDLVIEAVFEDLELKRQVLREVESVVPPETVFASNTSSIPIAQIAAASSRPENVVGMRSEEHTSELQSREK